MNVLGAGSIANTTEISASPRATGNDGARADKPFDKLLQDRPAVDNQARQTGRDTDGTQLDVPGSDAEAADQSAPSAAATERPNTDDSDGNRGADTDAPWPPPGLAVLLGVPAPEPSAPNAAAATNPAARIGQDKTTPLALAAQPPVAATGTTAMPATEDAAAPLVTAQIAVKTMTDDPDVDAPAPANVAPLLQSQPLQELRAPSALAVTEAPTPTPDLDSGDFDDAIGARVGWLADQKIGHAHIRISPDQMGQIEVKLQMDGDRVHASFTAANADVRHALESSLPRLREMLGEQGMQLAHADVGQQQNESPAQHAPRGADNASTGSSAESPDLKAGRPLRMRGLLDAYA
ncbi:MAG: flagellar hook-length control protein FliK [Stenotrophomonas sp.]